MKNSADNQLNQEDGSGADNGTNFTSAQREWRDLVSTLDQTRIKEQVAHDGIQ